MANFGVFVGGLVMFVLGLYVLGVPSDAHPSVAADRSARMGVAGLERVRLEAALIGAVGLFVMLLGTAL